MDIRLIIRQLSNDTLMSIRKDLDLVMRERNIIFYDENYPIERTRLSSRARSILVKADIDTVGKLKEVDLNTVFNKTTQIGRIYKTELIEFKESLQ